MGMSKRFAGFGVGFSVLLANISKTSEGGHFSKGDKNVDPASVSFREAPLYIKISRTWDNASKMFILNSIPHSVAPNKQK